MRCQVFSGLVIAQSALPLISTFDIQGLQATGTHIFKVNKLHIPIDGQLDADHKAVARVETELVFDPFFSVREALRIQSGYYGVRHNDDWIDELLHNLGLSDKAGANMRQLSGGMKRRVLVVCAQENNKTTESVKKKDFFIINFNLI